MKNIFTKIIAAGLLLACSFVSQGSDLILSTNVTASATSPAFLLLPSRAVVKQVLLVGGAGSGIIKLFDQNTLADPYFGTNYTSSAYATNFTYATNYVTSFVGYNGVTNWSTNTGVWTISVTNAAATNQLPIVFAGVVSASLSAVYTPVYPIVFAKGISAQVSTNMGVTIFYTTP